MTWRMIVVTGYAKLDYKIGYLVVRKEETTRVHLGEIHTLVIDSTAVSLTSALLNELIKCKVKVIFCDEKHHPASELMPCYGSHDTSLKLRTQIDWPELLKAQIWTELVAEKIRKQWQLLAHLGMDRESELLDSYLNTLRFGDETNREGHAAKVYFNALFGVDFTRGMESPFNMALNYGYALILSAFNREIVGSGYLTQLGIFHDNRFNPFNLSSDLMEPFRPIIDWEVYLMQPETFEHSEKMRLVNVLNKQVTIRGQKHHLHYAIRLYSKSVLDALNEQDIGKLLFYNHEL